MFTDSSRLRLQAAAAAILSVGGSFAEIRKGILDGGQSDLSALLQNRHNITNFRRRKPGGHLRGQRRTTKHTTNGLRERTRRMQQMAYDRGLADRRALPADWEVSA